MRPEDLRAFAARRWDEVEALDVAWWVERLRTAEAGEAARLGDELRRFVRETRPAWPDESSRASDLASHVEVGEALRRVRGPGGR
jgi:hypothetical protein